MSSDSGSEQLDYDDDLQIDSLRKNIEQHQDSKPGKPEESGSSKSKEDGVSKPIQGEMSMNVMWTNLLTRNILLAITDEHGRGGVIATKRSDKTIMYLCQTPWETAEIGLRYGYLDMMNTSILTNRMCSLMDPRTRPLFAPRPPPFQVVSAYLGRGTCRCFI